MNGKIYKKKKKGALVLRTFKNVSNHSFQKATSFQQTGQKRVIPF